MFYIKIIIPTLLKKLRTDKDPSRAQVERCTCNPFPFPVYRLCLLKTYPCKSNQVKLSNCWLNEMKSW